MATAKPAAKKATTKPAILKVVDIILLETEMR